MIISLGELKLVQHTEPDEKISGILNEPDIVENLSESRSYPGPMPTTICFRIEKDGEVIGQSCLKNIKWINHKAEISLFIKKNNQARGYGLEVLKAIIEYGFNRLNLFRLEAEVIDGNTASLKLMAKTGFTKEGQLRQAKFVNGKYKDLLRFGLLKNEYGG